VSRHSWAPCGAEESHICSYSMDRHFELENLRRSITMLRVGAPALDREAAMALLRELQSLEGQIRRLRDGMQRLLDEPSS
jgi:hypothetical protein